MRCHDASRKRSPKRKATKATADDGPHVATALASAPVSPPTFQPIRLIVGDGGREAPELEALPVQREGSRVRPQVVDRHDVALGLKEELRRAAGVGGAVRSKSSP